MDRRELIGKIGLGATAMVMAKPLLASHHEKGHASKNPLADLTHASAMCTAAAEACLAHCIVMLSKGDKKMADCAKAVSEMIPLCRAMTSLSAQNSDYAKRISAACVDACKACKKVCQEHKKHDVCKDCAKACDALIKASKKAFG